MLETPPPIVSKRRITRLAPLQLEKMLAVLHGIMGLPFVPFFLVMSAFATPMPAEQRVGILAFGMGFTLMVPVMYAVVGFVFGALGAAQGMAVGTVVACFSPPQDPGGHE